MFPSASATVRAPRDPAATLVSQAQITVGALRGGFAWDGTTLRPLLELLDVQFAGEQPYPVVDLSNVDTARAAVATAARDAIRAALGSSGPGRHLAALAGLLPPATDPTSPLADPVALVAAPTRELARLHRLVLTDPARGWKHMLGALAGALGLTGTLSGTGTQDDPWRVEIATVAPLTLELAAWNAGPGADPAPLRIGLRASAVKAPLTASWLAELIAADLPASGTAKIELMAGQHGRLTLAGPFGLRPVAGIAVGLHDADGRIDWQPGQKLAPVIHLNGITLTDGGQAVTVPRLPLPPAGYDPALPDLGLGIAAEDLFTALRIVLSRAAISWAGTPGFTVAGLVGLHGRLPGLPDDWPLLSLPAGAGLNALLENPFGPLRTWLGQIAVGLSADGTPFALHALAWLRAWFRGALPDIDAPDFGALDLDAGGSGTYDDPWRLGLTDAGRTELLVWLEPDGPPASWAAAIGTLAEAETDPGALLALGGRFQAFAPALRGTFGGSDVTSLGSALAQIESEVGAGDGVVPLDAAVPSDAGWTAGATIIDAAHHLLPSHPDAISQIAAQLDAWQPATDRAVLFIGPPFTDKSAWSALLASVGNTSTDAHFDLRSAPDPTIAPLGSVTASVAHYTADLADSGGDLSAVTAQVAAVVGRIRALRSDQPVILVAHSTAGLAARAFAAANPALVKGLITLGTPHGPTPLSALTTPDGAEALRAVHRLLGVAGISGSAADAVTELGNVLDGWSPSADGRLASPLSYPLDRFTGGTDFGTGGVPAVALAGQLGSGVLTAARDAIGSAAQGDTSRRAPTHLAFGLRAALSVPPAADGDVEVDAGVRLDAFRVRLSPGAPEPARAAHRLDVDVKIARPRGWLVATPAAHVRRTELGLTVEPSAARLITTPRAWLYDAALSAPTLPLVELGDPMAEGLLDAVVAALPSAALPSAALPTAAGMPSGAGTPGAALLDALDALGLVVRDAVGRPGLSADALTALRADAAAFLAPRIQPALERAGGLLGIAGPAGGPWQLAVPGTPLEIHAASGPWRIGLRTGQGIDLGHGLRIDADVEVTLPDLRLAVSAGLSRDGAALAFSSATGALTLTLRAEPARSRSCLRPPTLRRSSPRRCWRRWPPPSPRLGSRTRSARAGASARSPPRCATPAAGCARTPRSATAPISSAIRWPRC